MTTPNRQWQLNLANEIRSNPGRLMRRETCMTNLLASIPGPTVVPRRQRNVFAVQNERQRGAGILNDNVGSKPLCLPDSSLGESLAFWVMGWRRPRGSPESLANHGRQSPWWRRLDPFSCLGLKIQRSLKPSAALPWPACADFRSLLPGTAGHGSRNCHIRWSRPDRAAGLSSCGRQPRRLRGSGGR